MNRLEIRRAIQSAGNEFFERMYATNFELCNVAGEFMSLNENYVLLHQDIQETFKTKDILKTGFSKNQKRFLERLEKHTEDHGERMKLQQAEQMAYPSDADYCGESSCIFELEAAAKEITGDLNAGDVFIYLFRRFGYPKFGWDDQKQLVVYRLTTPMPGVILMVEPGVTGAFTFGYILRKDIAETYAAEDRKPFTDRYERFEAWAIAEKGIETIHTYCESDNEKLQRVWQTWATANKDNDFETQQEAEQTFISEQRTITTTLLEEYKKIKPHARPIPLADRPADSIISQVHTALNAAIRDLLRPVYVRDTMINIAGKVVWDESSNQDEDSVECALGTGIGVGDRME